MLAESNAVDIAFNQVARLANGTLQPAVNAPQDSMPAQQTAVSKSFAVEGGSVNDGIRVLQAVGLDDDFETVWMESKRIGLEGRTEISIENEVSY